MSKEDMQGWRVAHTDPMAAWSARVADMIEDLAELAERAEQGKERVQQVNAFITPAKVLGALLAPTEEHPTPEALEGIEADWLTQLRANLTSMVEALSTSAGIDRSAGDALAAKLRGNLAADVWDDLDPERETRDSADKTIERWQASAPVVKTTRKSGGSSTPRANKGEGKGQPLYFQCEKCGVTGVRSSGVMNDYRWGFLHHHRDAHNAGVLMEKGTQPYIDVTSAVEQVMQHGGSARVEGLVTYSDASSGDAPEQVAA